MNIFKALFGGKDNTSPEKRKRKRTEGILTSSSMTVSRLCRLEGLTMPYNV